MPSCVVPTCKNSSGIGKKLKGTTFHHFPADETKKLKWMKIIQRARLDEFWKPSNCSVICSIHFEEQLLYVTKGGLKRLKKDAIPTKRLALTSDFPESCTAISRTSTSANVEETPTSATKRPHYVNQGSQCTLCHQSIKGPRTMCVQCPMCYCLVCSSASSHDHHYMLHVPAGRDQEEVIVLLNKLWDLITTSVTSQETEDTEPVAPNTSAATEAGAHLVECKLEPLDEENDALMSGQEELEVHVSFTASDALDPIGFEIKQEVEDDFEDITLNVTSEPSSVLTKRKLVDGPQIPGHSREKHLMIEFHPPDQTVPGDNSNIPVTCDAKLKSNKKQKIGAEDREGRRGGKGVHNKNMKLISDKRSKHKADGSTVENTVKYTGIQGTGELIHPVSVKTEKPSDDKESMSVWGMGGRSVEVPSEEVGGLQHERELDAAVESIGGKALTETEPVLFKIGELMVEESSP